MGYSNCEHNAPKDYCPMCNDSEEIKNRIIDLMDCPYCFDGIDYHYEPNGDWEEECRICKGTGMLDKEQSEKRHKFLTYYWKEKITPENLK